MRLGVHSLSSMNCIAQETQADAVAADRPDDILASILDNPHLPTPGACAARRGECQPAGLQIGRDRAAPEPGSWPLRQSTQNS